MLYKKFADTLAERFGTRVQKISVNAGFTCPNRDGSKGTGGCIYCNNLSFLPPYCHPAKSVREQLLEGMEFFKKYKSQAYIAYFQSYTNTYIKGIDADENFRKLRAIYEEALSVDGVVGLAIGTRPDCVDKRLLDYFAELSKRYYVSIEYGVESTLNETLKAINRGHLWEDSVFAIEESAKRGIEVGAHLILGLPGESREQILQHAERLSALPIDMLKLHQLQIVRDTRLSELYQDSPEQYPLFSLEEYIDLLIDFIAMLRPTIALDRFVSQSPAEFLIAPKWQIKNYEFVHKLEKRMIERNVRQGDKFGK